MMAKAAAEFDRAAAVEFAPTTSSIGASRPLHRT
jgi:hypothetical protein